MTNPELGLAFDPVLESDLALGFDLVLGSGPVLGFDLVLEFGLEPVAAELLAVELLP